MSAAPDLIVESDADTLAEAVAGRVIDTLVAAQQARGQASLVLTAGSILEKVFAALSAHPGLGSVAWNQVDIFWGDERFVASDSSDRNDLPARRLLLDHLDLDPARVFPMPATNGPDGDDLDAATARYNATLADVAAVNRVDGGIPLCDVALIGVGPDGHCCSLFPEHPGTAVLDAAIVAVRNSPKPPPERLSFTFTALEKCREVWIIASGDGKADAVAAALGGADRVHTPSAGARGSERTLWLVDTDAASKLPQH